MRADHRCPSLQKYGSAMVLTLIISNVGKELRNWKGFTLPSQRNTRRELIATSSTLQAKKNPNDPQPFVPAIIKSMTKKEDYFLFKLDIDSRVVKRGTVDHLLSNSEDLSYVDEFLWEHHVGGNYLMRYAWKNDTDDLTIHDSYQYFLCLRQKGVRAHSWV